MEKQLESGLDAFAIEKVKPAKTFNVKGKAVDVTDLGSTEEVGLAGSNVSNDPWNATSGYGFSKSTRQA